MLLGKRYGWTTFTLATERQMVAIPEAVKAKSRGNVRGNTRAICRDIYKYQFTRL